MIRRAQRADLPAVEEAFEQLYTHEQAHGSFSGWRKGIFPEPHVLSEACRRGRLFVLRGEKDELLASMVLGDEDPRGISSVMWHYPAAPEEILSINAVCVAPEEQGRGYGTRMLRYALETAKRNGKAVVRCAVFERNEPMLGLSKRLGFERCDAGMVMLGGIMPQRMVFLEYAV